MNKKANKRLDRRVLDQDVQAFLAKGGRIATASAGGRINPCNEHRHNTFLFLDRQR